MKTIARLLVTAMLLVGALASCASLSPADMSRVFNNQNLPNGGF